MIMKRRLIHFQHPGIHSNGPHVRYFLMTLTAAFVLAVGLLTMFFILLQGFIAM